MRHRRGADTSVSWQCESVAQAVYVSESQALKRRVSLSVACAALSRTIGAVHSGGDVALAGPKLRSRDSGEHGEDGCANGLLSRRALSFSNASLRDCISLRDCMSLRDCISLRVCSCGSVLVRTGCVSRHAPYPYLLISAMRNT